MQAVRAVLNRLFAGDESEERRECAWRMLTRVAVHAMQVVRFREFSSSDVRTALQAHPNEEVYETAVCLLDTYFAQEAVEEDADENIAPNHVTEAGFAFGMRPPPPVEEALAPYCVVAPEQVVDVGDVD